jgi:hypothetical protein
MKQRAVTHARYQATMARLRMKPKLEREWLERAEQLESGADTDASELPPPRPHVEIPARQGFVYIVAVQQYVKIGFTGNVGMRAAILQTSSPFEVTVIASFTGTMDDEAALHARFAQYRHRGEWFRREGALADWIQGGCQL